MTTEQPEDGMHAAYQQWRMQIDRLEAERVPVWRVALANMLDECTSDPDETDSCIRCGEHIRNLPNTDMRLRQLASFDELDLPAIANDYFLFHVGCDTFGSSAPNRFFEFDDFDTPVDLDKYLNLILLDMLAYAATNPDVRQSSPPAAEPPTANEA